MRRLLFIDSLRGVAAVYVVIYHMTLLTSPNLALPHWASTTVLNGGSAVTLFFIVSAFSLCHTMGRHLRDGIGAFYVRRFFRIAPLFYLMLIFYLVRDSSINVAQYPIAEIAENIAFLFNFSPAGQAGIVAASWTIGVEMLFYLAFPLIYTYSKDYARIAALFFLSLCVGVVAQEVFYYLPLSPAEQVTFWSMSIFRHFPAFVVGVAAYAVFDRRIKGFSVSPALGAALILGSLYLYHTFLHGGLNIIFADPSYWQALIYGCLVIGLAIHPSAVFVNRLSLYCGKLSYSIYLAHPPVIALLAPVYRAISRLPVPTTLQFFAAGAVTLSSVVAVAAVLYRFIEQPGMKLGQLLIGMRAERAAVKALTFR